MDPYRKDDWGASWDLALGGYLAGHGYAYCRLDVRGTGSSPGVATDEYTAAETLDGHDAVEWLATQPWCTGAVGMWGLSYGGFTSIQVAATRPPHLRAIVPIQATDDRYTDDVHYVGGAMTVSELAQYAVSQVAENALPPLPSAWGEGWLDGWRDRLEATPVWLFEWARQQRGSCWRRLARARLGPRRGGSAPPGWLDGQCVDALPDAGSCVAPRRRTIGPWSTACPTAPTAPNIDWRARWSAGSIDG
jgi:predicted acyl esterase